LGVKSEWCEEKSC